jgi:phosphatidylinositol alpha 1,6-mannosyltransferase
VKIAIVTESFLPQLNGVTNSVLRVLNTLTEEGHDVIVIAPTTPGDYYRGVRTYRVPSFALKSFPVGLPSPKLTRLLDSFDPDLVHVASPFILGAQAITWANKAKVPSVAVYQTDIAGYMRRYNMSVTTSLVERVVALIHRDATITLAPTPASQADLRRWGLSSVEVWGRGVDVDNYHPHNRTRPTSTLLRDSLGGDTGVIVGYVGRLAAEKQVHRFAELVTIPNIRILIVGDGPERDKLQEMFAHAPVTFLGALSGTELADAYSAMDVFVHFGAEETFGQTIQEAQASGIPVAAPHAGGPVHLIEHGVSGYLFSPHVNGDARAIVDELVAQPQLRARVGEAGRRRVLGNTWVANNQRLLEHYTAARIRIGARELV